MTDARCELSAEWLARVRAYAGELNEGAEPMTEEQKAKLRLIFSRSSHRRGLEPPRPGQDAKAG